MGQVLGNNNSSRSLLGLHPESVNLFGQLAHPAAAGGRGFGVFPVDPQTIPQLVAAMPGDDSNEGRIARTKILDATHRRVGVGIGDRGFYAVFGQ